MRVDKSKSFSVAGFDLRSRLVRVDESLQEQCHDCLAPFRRRFQGQIRQLARTKVAIKALDSGLRRNNG